MLFEIGVEELPLDRCVGRRGETSPDALAAELAGTRLAAR